MNQQAGGGFAVIGLSAVVSNDDPDAIGALWASFRAENIRVRLGPDASEDVFCVYHDYEGGVMDPYRMTIGYRATAAADGLRRVTIPQQSMAVYDATGPQPQAVIAQWQAIWQSDLARRFVADYDVYDPRTPDTVRVHVGLNGPIPDPQTAS